MDHIEVMLHRLMIFLLDFAVKCVEFWSVILSVVRLFICELKHREGSSTAIQDFRFTLLSLIYWYGGVSLSGISNRNDVLTFREIPTARATTTLNVF